MTRIKFFFGLIGYGILYLFFGDLKDPWEKEQPPADVDPEDYDINSYS